MPQNSHQQRLSQTYLAANEIWYRYHCVRLQAGAESSMKAVKSIKPTTMKKNNPLLKISNVHIKYKQAKSTYQNNPQTAPPHKQ